MFNVDKNKIGVTEIFLVKYDINGQKFLDYHEDGSEFSFVLSLNDEFEGGGTNFKFNDKTIKLPVGDCLVFSGRNTHRGNEITSGTRYILTGFINYGGADYCEEYVVKYDVYFIYVFVIILLIYLIFFSINYQNISTTY
jgi:hypothetical protein